MLCAVLQLYLWSLALQLEKVINGEMNAIVELGGRGR